jgi:small subunit ribosomal protein S17
MSEESKKLHELSGVIVSCKAEKTLTVRIDRIVPHPVYGKFIRRSTKLLAHDEKNEGREGDVVILSACRPISRRKVWKLERIVERGK